MTIGSNGKEVERKKMRVKLTCSTSVGDLK